MSESDSDLDFESADEDTEFATITKTTVIQKSISNDEGFKSFSTEVGALSAVSNKISSGNSDTDTKTDECFNISTNQPSPIVKKEIVDDFSKLQSSDKLQDSKASKTDSCSYLKKSSENADAPTDTLIEYDQIIDRAKPIGCSKVDAPTAKCLSEFQSDKSSQKPDQETEELIQKPDQQTELSKTPRERVLLRLEKKQLSRDSFFETEKPSDFGNFFRNPNERRLSRDFAENEKPSDFGNFFRNPNERRLSRDFVENEKPSDFVNVLRSPNRRRQSSPWGFSGWGSSLISSAASSVSTFSTQVSQGIGSVLETVESTLGAPPPEKLAEVLSEKKAEATEIIDVEKEKENEESSTFLPNVSSWTKVLENTGSKVIMGGLDTLELIGKKTMDILTEGDPGLRKKRAAFSGDANLSELLKEIKAQADAQSKNNPEDDIDVHYSQIFDEKQGLAHLEALEMLSKQSEAKFQRLLMRHSKHLEIKKRLKEMKSICENIPSLDDPSDCENFEDFEAVFKKYTFELSFPLNAENIIKTQRETNKTIADYENASEDNPIPPKEIFQFAICSLADFTAKCIETFHKAAEFILVQPNFDPDLEHCATNLTGLTTVMCIEVNNLSSRYHKCLEKTAEYWQKKGISENADVKTLATNVYVEASNSNNYIQEAYQMLVPVLQARFLEAID